MKKKSIFVCVCCNSRNYSFYLSSDRDKSLKLNKYCSCCRLTKEHLESR